MIATEFDFPLEARGSVLDGYLAAGWFRMGDFVFTTGTITPAGREHRVHWMRYPLNGLEFSRAAKRVLQRCRHFQVGYRPATIEARHDQLFEIYKQGIRFHEGETIESLLAFELAADVFDTELVEVQDRGKLVAAGYFDHGAHATAGILNFYHPDYKTFSPGKLLMLLQLQRTRELGKRYYYPGYIVEGYPKFDYKLFVNPAAAEVYVPGEGRWRALHPVNASRDELVSPDK